MKTAVLPSRKTKKGAHLSALLSRAVHTDLFFLLNQSLQNTAVNKLSAGQNSGTVRANSYLEGGG